jgi:flagellar hook-associated protein FlgK
MTRLVQVQQAYDAAAKIINTVDQMMQTVLSLGSAA